MPRGVYDRSKTKTQRAAEKASDHKTDAAPKRRGRKPGSKNAASASTAPQQVKGSGGNRATYTGDGFTEFNEIRSNLVTLNSIATTFGGNLPGVKEEIQANVQLMSELRQKHFPTARTETKETEAVQNGTSQSQQYSSTVPLPPSPVQVIPPHS